MVPGQDVQAREQELHDGYAASLDIDELDAAPRSYDLPHETAILEAVGDLRGAEVLDLGCGTGELTLQLVAAGAHVTALDLSPGLVNLTRRRVERAGGTAAYVAAPAEDTGLPDGRFDAIVGKWVLHHLPDHAAAANEIHRLLAPGGVAAFSDTSAMNPLLRFARRHFVGRAGIAAYGTPDEHPLTREDMTVLSAPFSRARVDFPAVVLVQLADRHIVKWRSEGFSLWCRRADAWLSERGGRASPLSYYVRLTLWR